ncbi:nucleotide sugar dehydrogenase [Nocardioides sp.]|uniref:nucleotide sugar dehydrogenase n=1 Tax=Nocardioides sp. TaxID=35761 RepID=UPI002CFB1355|nr:nucleotide sugar dehydrogenase [Nocardioides sp.]HXH77209.1 nucleotide sugar dehydrogenase [Nocardioides sp.]
MSEQTQQVDFAVIGLGYVGLPLAQAACARGLTGLGLDVSKRVVDQLNGGQSHVDDLADTDISAMLDRGFSATTDETRLKYARVIVICVPTPLAQEGAPDLGAVQAAAEAVSRNVSPGTLVILESTTWPGTTNEVLVPILERSGLTVGRDLYVAFSPERIDPGNSVYGIVNTPKVVGGIDETSRDRAVSFYEQFIDTVVLATGTREAEMAKLLENTYRQVNIALVNEMAKFSHDMGIDFWNVIECASSKPFGFQAFYPGPGVGGHCIPIDPGYLSHRVQAQLGYPFRFVELSQEVNRSMPKYVADRAWRRLNNEGKAMSGARVLILGVTYKAGIADQRESPATPLAIELLALGAELSFYDPYVQEWHVHARTFQRVNDLDEALSHADLVIHLQGHADYDNDRLERAGVPVLDTRGTLSGSLVDRL